MSSARALALVDDERSLYGLVATGMLDPEKVSALKKARDIIKDEKMATEEECRPRLCGDKVLNFYRYGDDRNPTGDPIPVTIVGMPDAVDVKRKHYWIYSILGNYGKTRTLEKEIEDVYSSTMISDVNNAYNLCDRSQFVMVDSYGPRNKFELSQFNGLTSGNASKSHINRKSYGQSFVPRPDAQFIIASNPSPYETYAEYDRKSGRRVIPQSALNTIEARFHIIRLDGSDMDEKFIDPEYLSDEEFVKQVRWTFYHTCSRVMALGCLTSQEVRDGLAKCYVLLSSRSPTGHTTQSASGRRWSPSSPSKTGPLWIPHACRSEHDQKRVQGDTDRAHEGLREMSKKRKRVVNDEHDDIAPASQRVKTTEGGDHSSDRLFRDLAHDSRCMLGSGRPQNVFGH